MQKIDVLVHTHDGQSPHVVQVNEDATIEDLLRLVSPEGHSDLRLARILRERGFGGVV